MIFSAICVYVLMFHQPAHAYLDPSSGGMLLQILLGGMAGLVAVGKIYWHSLKNFFKRLFNAKTGSPE